MASASPVAQSIFCPEFDGFAAALDKPQQRAVQMKARLERRDLVADLLEFGDVDAGFATARVFGVAAGLKARPAAIEPVGFVGAVALPRLELGIEAVAPIGFHFLDVGRRHHALADELVAVDLQRGRMLGDRLVHQRLGERRLVALVVAVPAIAEHVDDDRLLKLLPEFGRHLGGEHHGFRIVAVDVEDRRLDHLGDVGRIGRRSRVARVGGEADLIVDDEVHRAAGAVAAQAGQPETLRHHALAGERGVAVDQERHHHGAILARGAELILFGAHLAEHDRIDDFEVRRIGGQRQVHLVVVELAIRRGAEMVLDVARAFDLVRRRRAALEFVEDRPMRLAHDLGQHIEPAAVRHAHDDLLHAQRAAALDDLFQRRNHQLGAVEAEALGAGEFHVAEFFEAFRFDELVEDGALALAGEGDLLVRPLDAFLNPTLLRAVGDMQKLDAQRLTIGAAQDADDLTDGAEFKAEHLVEENRPVEIGFAKSIRPRIELFLVIRRLQAERIEVGMEMPAGAIGADQHERPYRVAGGALNVGGGKLDALGLCLRFDLRAERLADFGPVAVERRDELAALWRRPVGTAPRRTIGAFDHVAGVILEALEEGVPFGIDRFWVGFVARIQVFDVRGVGTVKERCESEGSVRVLARHVRIPSLGKWAAEEPKRRATNQPGPGAGDFPCTLFNRSMPQPKD